MRDDPLGEKETAFDTGYEEGVEEERAKWKAARQQSLNEIQCLRAVWSGKELVLLMEIIQILDKTFEELITK